MQKLILSAILILGSFKSFSQTATVSDISTPDSIVCIPKHIVVKVIQDLEKGDMNEKQVEILKNHLAMVFVHEIDPSFGDQKKQDKLNNLHNPSGHPNVLMKC